MTIGDTSDQRCAVVAATESDELLQYWERALHDVCEIFIAASLEALKDHLVDYKPSVVVLDLALPGFTLQKIPELLKISPATKMLLCCDEFNEEEGIAVIKAGGKGYVQKNGDVFLLRKAIEVIKKGELWIPRYLVGKLLNRAQVTFEKEREFAETMSRKQTLMDHSLARLSQLTRRENEIAELIGNGYSNKEIGGVLKISESTVKAHLSAIYHKLGLTDRLTLALFITNPTRQVEEPAQVD